jgi:hypothetical protein
MSSEDSSGESEPEDAASREPDQTDPDEIEPINADQLMEEMQARRDEQREQVSFDWCETIRVAGECYREHDDVDAVADDLQLDSDDVREAVTVYRLRFEEPPQTAAWIVDKAGRTFFALNADVDEAVDLEDREYTVEDLVREYVGTVYLEYDVDAEPVGDPVEQTSPELSIDLEEFLETIPNVVSVPTGTFQAAVQPMLERRQKLIQTAVQSVVFRQQELIQAAIQPILNQRQELLRAAMLPALTAIAQQQSIAASAVASLTDSLDDIVFPESVMADLTAIQPAIDAAAVSTPTATTAGGFSTVDQPSVPVPEPTPSPTDTDSVDSVEPEVTPDPATVDTAVEPSVDAGMDVSPVAATVDTTLPNPDTVSPELVYEIPALLVESMLAAGEARTWFTSLPYGHQITVVNVMLVSATFYVTRNASMAALSGFLSPAVRQLIINEDEE